MARERHLRGPFTHTFPLIFVLQITMSDFVIADVTDSMMDGYISGFPNTYASKVGKTSDEMYKGICTYPTHSSNVNYCTNAL